MVTPTPRRSRHTCDFFPILNLISYTLGDGGKDSADRIPASKTLFQGQRLCRACAIPMPAAFGSGRNLHSRCHFLPGSCFSSSCGAACPPFCSAHPCCPPQLRIASCSTWLPVRESVYAFTTIRAIFAEGLKMFRRPGCCRDRPAAFAIRSNGNTE